MTGLCLYDAVKQYVYQQAANGEEPFEALRRFVKGLAENHMHAVGFSHERNLSEPIPPEFWAWFLSRLEPSNLYKRGVCIDEISDCLIDNTSGRQIYGNVVVHEGPYRDAIRAGGEDKGARRTRGGHPAKASWPHVVAEAVRLCYVGELPTGFPRTGQKELVEKLQKYLADNGITEPLGDDTLVKLVRQIYHHCRQTE